ncbi:MAG: hypothetical protein H5U02_11630 [Clostridia bacterium]|nr:hypothetical protein [Clostridia bacterium]
MMRQFKTRLTKLEAAIGKLTPKTLPAIIATDGTTWTVYCGSEEATFTGEAEADRWLDEHGCSEALHVVLSRDV